MNDPTTFAEWLSSQMEARRLNQSQLATYLGIRSSAVNRWFHHASIPNTATCQALARVFRLPLEDVLRAAGHLPPLDPGELAEDAPGYLSADLTRAVSIARRLISIGGEDALEEWTELGEALLEVKQRRAARG